MNPFYEAFIFCVLLEPLLSKNDKFVTKIGNISPTVAVEL